MESLTANVSQQDKDDLTVLAHLNGRSVRSEAGQAVMQRNQSFREQIDAVLPKERRRILEAAKKK